jgi:predicted Rossmann fold nucleotide-binding protein DprA/Smf involved in DNA uptake
VTTVIAIIGSRSYEDEEKVRAFVRSLPEDWEVVSGGAPGPDSWGESEARARGMTVTVHYPQYEIYGRKLAPMVRNKSIVGDCDLLVGFWDGSSGGTLDAARFAVASRRPIFLVRKEDQTPTVAELAAKLWASKPPSA